AAAALCEALGVAARTTWSTDLAATTTTFRRAAQVAAEHGLTPWRVTALVGAGMIEALDADDQPTLRQARELAVDAGMLAQVSSTDLIASDVLLQVDGPRSAEPLARRAVETAERLALPEMTGPARLQTALCLAAAGNAAGATAILRDVRSWALVPGDLAAAVAIAEGISALVEHDLTRAAAGLDAVEALLDATAPLLAPVGAWVLVRTVTGGGEAEARERLSGRPAGLSTAIRGALAYADAVTAGRDGRPDAAATHFAGAERLLAARPWWRRLLRTVVLGCSVADGWGDPVPELRADLAAHEAAGDVLLARTCRALMRRAGAAPPRRRGTPVPPRLRALGVSGREFDVLQLVTQGLTNGQVAERLVLSRRTVDTHVASLLAKTGSVTRAELGRWAPPP
ncbi:MAG TPA: helix-turn-helix transcriptional regulator, partial [Pseudonocardia sp.]|nr:helix-turn-helix transcriptional regulator [Pseudonocardia sp.]